MKFLIAGLGNIGAEYELTRHNIGFLVVDQLADKLGCTFKNERFAAHATGRHKGRTLHLIQPSTYMNLSGKAVNYWMNELKVPPANLLVIVDDVALPFGALRLRPKGSAAGHNGLKNIEEVLGGQEYPRLRFGIGSNYPRGNQVDYVLSVFAKEEMTELPAKIDLAVEMIYSFCTAGIEKTMSLYNS